MFKGVATPQQRSQIVNSFLRACLAGAVALLPALVKAGPLLQRRQFQFTGQVPYDCTPLLKRASRGGLLGRLPLATPRIFPSGSSGEVDVALLAEPFGLDGRSAVMSCLIR